MSIKTFQGVKSLRFLPPDTTPDAARLIATRAVRSFGDGFFSVLLPLYLSNLGFSGLRIGAMTTATLADQRRVQGPMGNAALPLPSHQGPGRVESEVDVSSVGPITAVTCGTKRTYQRITI